MKAYVLDAIGELNYKDVEIRPLKQGEALVEVHAAGICGSDIPRIFFNGTYHFPTIPGHEFAGRVVAVYGAGSLVPAVYRDSVAVDISPNASGQGDGRWLGKRVGIFPLIPCRECDPCAAHNYEMCEHYSYLGSRTDGGFAEYVIVPIWNLIEIPDSIPYHRAAMMEPAAVALHAVRRLGLEPTPVQASLIPGEPASVPELKDKKVLLIGLGTIGGLIAQWLSICGVRHVVATGHHLEQGDLMWLTASAEYRFIKTAGFTSAIDAAEEEGTPLEEDSFDYVIDCVNAIESISDALRLVKPAGRIVEVGNPKSDISLNRDIYWKLLRKQVEWTGTWNSGFDHCAGDDWSLVLENIDAGRLQLDNLITHRLAFEELPKGLDIMRFRADFCNKVMIER